MQNEQTIVESQNESTDQTPSNDKQPQSQQPITSSQQSEMQFPYQFPMMPMPQMFNYNQFMKPGQSEFYVRRSKEEQQLQNQQYQQMFDPSFNFQGFMPMMPMMPMMMPMMPFYNNQNYYQENYENEEEVEQQQQEQQQQQQQSSKEKESSYQRDSYNTNKGKYEKQGRQQKYQKRQQYKPKYGRNYQGYQQQQRDRPKQLQQQESYQQNKSRIRMDSDSFPALPAESKHFIYQKKGIQGLGLNKQNYYSIQGGDEEKKFTEQNENKDQTYTEPKTFYTLNQIEKIFKELKSIDQIKISENLSKLDKNDVPIVFPEGCLQLEIIEPSKIIRRREEKIDNYYENEKSRRKNTYDYSNVASRHKFSLQITTYEKKEVK